MAGTKGRHKNRALVTPNGKVVETWTATKVPPGRTKRKNRAASKQARISRRKNR